MTSITYVGMDVHTTNYTLCAYQFEGQKAFAQTTINPDIKELLKYLENLKSHIGNDAAILCGYEAGCLGYTLYHQLEKHDYACVILAPTSIPAPVKSIKTDKRDAKKIAQCLAYGTYSPVYVPNDDDNAVKEFIRMRDDAQTMLKQTKQRIIAFCTRHGRVFQGGASRWTPKYMSWLRSLRFDNAVLQETLDEYLAIYSMFNDKLERFDKRIAEFANEERYVDKVKRLVCLKGIQVHTAMSLISEVGDFNRFPSAQQFAAFLGLVPKEHSSGNSYCRGGITKAGNTHLRRLLTESANCFSHARVGRKCPELKKRQYGNPPQVISYADKANDRLRRKYVRISTRSKSNIAKSAIARELACFIWGLMTDHIYYLK